MSSSFGTWEGVLGLDPVSSPYVSGIPQQIQQGDSVTWDDNPFADLSGTAYDSTSYAMAYTIAGPIAAPLVVNSIANGSGWRTSLTTAQTAALAAGLYWWNTHVTATNVRVTVARGELTVLPDLALAGASYDGRTQAEIALDQALAAFATFSTSGGRVKAYTIGHRSMTFETLSDVKACVDFWRARVVTEKSIAGGARDRHLHLRFDRTR